MPRGKKRPRRFNAPAIKPMNRLAFLVLLLPVFFSCATKTPAPGSPDAGAGQPDTAPPPETPAGKSGYVLDWYDEFDYAGRPDPAKWDYETGFVRNNELQWYQSENAVVGNGVLLIEGKKLETPVKNPSGGDRQWIEYTSSCVITKNKKHFLRGVIQVRARIPGDLGSWPAIWTLGASYQNPGYRFNTDWPGCGEIDIMELYRPGAAADRSAEPLLLSNWCWKSPVGGPWGSRWDDWKTPVSRWAADRGTTAEDWLGKFHLWELHWDETSMYITLDGALTNTLDLDPAGAALSNPEGFLPRRPFQEEHYLLMNLAIGGNNGGAPDELNRWPLRCEIDYVRYYRKD